ncbi:hypothetical protein BVH03_25295 [Pseudomonas sp. PA15(2017)]|uniref:immunity 8 family protein n=1 Tax=Pseudomonas sp. PA15(2017) TaxID=1932111 RepID=UPI000959E7E0|nr:immunity 8 family protein [Pseudomonas sp. PA15(2017)]OLU22201.1 hypothetical protein BVH03_25295 [Pseudomonas sp. PA15(2017)]
MNAELKRLHSPDIYDLENYKPESPTSFNFLLQAMIGPAGEDGEESFDIDVCTPKWIEENCEQDVVLIGRHYLIVREYNYKKIDEFIRKFLLSCVGEDWNEVANKVARLGFWEFEDYES